MNKTLAIFLTAAALALGALWARGHEDEARPPPPAVVEVPRPPPPAAAPPVVVEAPPSVAPPLSAPDREPPPQVRRGMRATLELSYAGDAPAELIVDVAEWPVGTNLYAWTLPYSNGEECDPNLLVLDLANAAILGEVTETEQAFRVESDGAIHGVVVGVDEADARARLESLLQTPVEQSTELDVPGVLYRLQGTPAPCGC